MKTKTPVTPRMRPLPLHHVRLTGGPLHTAQQLDARYLLSLEPDRMLAYFRQRAGLPPKAKGYGGWDGDNKNLTGHIAGHYLSGVSLMWAATGDKRFKERADYLVAELKAVQEKHGDGYLGALEGGKERFAEVARGDIRSGGFDLNGLWSPWYVFHKVFAGLRDAYRFTGNKDALTVEAGFAAWTEQTLKNLDDAQLQKMLHTEFGGMGEVLADLAHDTRDPRWLALSDRFEHRAVIAPLSEGKDILNGLHGNTQVPKLLGSLSRYEQTGNPSDRRAVDTFWDAVAHHHSFATGGHGRDEYFGPRDTIGGRISGRTAESCNVYNMLKLARRLFALSPRLEYAEFAERALFNHVLASIDLNGGSTCYMVPVGQGVRHEYQDMQEHFTCCVGSGMESHALHGDGIFYESGSTLAVLQFVPAQARWVSQGATVTIETAFPESETVTLRLTLAAPKRLTLALRRPSWAGAGFAVAVNGKPQTVRTKPGELIPVTRTWKSGDTLTLTLPFTLREEPTRDLPRRRAFLWGPLVLAGDFGPESTPYVEGSASILVTSPTATSCLREQPGKRGVFALAAARWSATAEPAPAVPLKPLYQLSRRVYGVYWDRYSPAEWKEQSARIAQERQRQEALRKATIGTVQPGEMQPERDAGFVGENTSVERVEERPGRRARGWFSFVVPVEPESPCALVVTFHSIERRRPEFEVLVEGVALPGTPTFPSGEPRFFDHTWALPETLTKGKQKLTVRFQSRNGGDVPTIFGIRTIRTSPILATSPNQ